MVETRRLAVLALALCAASSCTNDVLDASYATQPDAVSAGAVSRGWVPAWTPSDATELREVHNIDTNQSALLFNLPPSSAWKPPKECQPAMAGQLSDMAFTRDWIPNIERGYDLYICPSGLAGALPQLFAGLAVHRSRQQVLYWRMLAR